MSPKVLFIDLGGVIVENKTFDFFKTYSVDSLSKEVFSKRWLLSKAVKDFETGKINDYDFSYRIIDEFKLNTSIYNFGLHFPNFIGELTNSTKKLLKDLKLKYKLVLVSNSNFIYRGIVTEKYKIESYFDFVFFSDLVGLLKPDKDFFEYVLKETKFKKEEIYFFDDSKLNIDAASSIGIKSFRVDSVGEIVDLV